MEVYYDKMIFEGNVASNWERFKRKFQLYLDAFCERDVTEKKKVALFLHRMGDAGYDVYTSFSISKEDEKVEKLIKDIR